MSNVCCKSMVLKLNYLIDGYINLFAAIGLIHMHDIFKPWIYKLLKANPLFYIYINYLKNEGTRVFQYFILINNLVLPSQTKRLITPTMFRVKI